LTCQKHPVVRAIPFKYTWERGNATYFRPPTPTIGGKKFHLPPPEFTSESTPLPPEKEEKNHKNNFLHFKLGLIVFYCSKWSKVICSKRVN
jgi:hypothetical protein